MSDQTREGSAKNPHTTQQSERNYTPSLLDHAERLVLDMKGRLPENGLEHGVMHQITGKTCNGAECTFIIVFVDHATFGDLSSGVFVTVDSAGRRHTAMMGASR